LVLEQHTPIKAVEKKGTKPLYFVCCPRNENLVLGQRERLVLEK
jgi:hypothetical protein